MNVGDKVVFVGDSGKGAFKPKPFEGTLVITRKIRGGEGQLYKLNNGHNYYESELSLA